jgi:hypothetical protein
VLTGAKPSGRPPGTCDCREPTERRLTPALRGVIASFHARAPALPPAPRHLQARRAAGALRVSWSPSTGAARYLVTVRLSDGRSELFLRRAKAVRRLTVRGVKPTASAVVRGSGLDAINHAGHARTKRVARRHAPRLRRLPPLRAYQDWRCARSP